MKPSIATRILRSYLLMALILVTAMGMVVEFVNEALEEDMLTDDVSGEIDYMLNHHDLLSATQPIIEESTSFTIVFIPNSYQGDFVLPGVFASLDDDFTGEANVGDSWYLVSREELDNGSIALARNITNFELQEIRFNNALVVIGVIILGLSYGYARLLSKRIITPLVQLTDHIRHAPIDTRTPMLHHDFKDREIAEIADAYNHFQDELAAYVQRENSLTNMASHELRTPISIISGAVEVIEQRDRLGDDDRKTLRRIKNTAREMQSNLSAMLNLARHQEMQGPIAIISTRELVDTVLTEMAGSYPVNERVHIDEHAHQDIETSPVLAKILFRNLISNALEHTTGNIWIQLYEDRIIVGDDGKGLSVDQVNRLTNPGDAPDTNNQGLGLYIATLVSERLGWTMRLENPATAGTWFTVTFSALDDLV